ncbi:MAG TPA: NAD(P)-dependent oxidoreductase [Syntrophales bacterium]|nr:NAD(P)-dependent oxidoreductase [Syntrophales bacterium]
MKKLGFLGLGIMGGGMAANLVKAGFDVTVWNRTTAKMEELVSLGARGASSPREVVAGCDVTFAMLADPRASEEVCFGPGGVLEAMGEGRGYVDMSTVDGDTSRRIAAAVAAKGGRFLEAPVSGSRQPAREGTLVIMAAGDRSLYDEAMPALERMGKLVLYLGEVGKAAAMKLVVNMIMGGMMAVFCEGLSLGKRAGLRIDDILAVLDNGAMANPMFRLKGPMIQEGRFPVAFPLKHMQKDLRLALLLGDVFHQPLASAAAANETFKRARDLGLGDEDFSAVFRAVS